MATCANCDKKFTKKSGKKGFYRFSLEKVIPHSGLAAREALSNLTGARFTPVSVKSQGRFLCPSCWSSLSDQMKYRNSVQEFWGKTGEKTYIGHKRKSEESESFEVPLKKPRFTSTPLQKQGPRKSLFSPRAKRSTKWESIVTAVRNRQYGRAISGLFSATKGSHKKFIEFLNKTIRQEVAKVLSSKTDFALCQEANIPSIGQFTWDSTIAKLQENAPLLCNILTSAATKKGEEESLIRGKSKNLKPQLGTAVLCILHARAPRKASFLPTLFSIQFWRGGLKRETIKQLSHTGICLGDDATLAAVDKISTDFDNAAKICKTKIEEQVQSGASFQPTEEDMETSMVLAATIPNIEEEFNSPSDIEDETILYSDDEIIDDNGVKNQEMEETEEESEGDKDTESKEGSLGSDDDEEESVPEKRPDFIDLESVEEAMEPEPGVPDEMQPGFTLCWDNVGKKITTRHPTKDTTNTYLNMALGYMAVNRVPTTHLPWDDSSKLVKASDIPTDMFIPSDKDFECLRNRVEVIVGRYITRHLPGFKAHFEDCSIPHILHDHSAESCRRSVLVNLGVFDENPSSTQGAIGIYEKLQQYVPSIQSKPYTTLVYGDGLSCERGNDAHRARSNGLSPSERLEGLEPAAQEFHKEMLLLQDYYDEFFKGSSACDRGTLCQVKNMFNFRQVKADISDNFSTAWELMCLITEGYVCLLAMKILGMDERSSRPSDAPPSIENASLDERKNYFNSVCASLVKEVWHALDTKCLKIADDSGPPLYCCGEEKDEPLICCEERFSCPRGEVFHYSCAEIDPENLPDPWYCSDECRQRKSFYRYCHCHEDLGEDTPMIGCAAESKCTRFEWYHYQCVGLRGLSSNRRLVL